MRGGALTGRTGSADLRKLSPVRVPLSGGVVGFHRVGHEVTRHGPCTSLPPEESMKHPRGRQGHGARGDRRLRLRKEVLRRLGGDDLAAARGGAGHLGGCSIWSAQDLTIDCPSVAGCPSVAACLSLLDC